MTALSIVLPCFDEAGRLPHTAQRYLAHFPADPAEIELVIVDDGSTDGTLAVAEEIAARDRRVRVLREVPNHGKGFAVRTGVLAAKGERIAFTDADGSYGPDEVERVVAALDRSPVAIGVRPLGGSREAPDGRRPASATRRLASRVFNQAMRRILGLPFHDTQCGLKAFRREAAAELFRRNRLDGFAFDAEILFLARRLGIDVVEVPVHAVDHGGSKVRLAGDALRMLREMWSVRRAAARGAYNDPREDPDQTRLRDHAG